MPVRYVLRLDDIRETMDWEKVSRIVSFARERSIRPLLGVIPDNQDVDLQRYERRADAWAQIGDWYGQGAEIALHGYQHRRITTARGLFGPFAASEFAAVPLDEQRRRIALGYSMLGDRGLEACAFVAPFHSLDAGTLEALSLETPIRIVTDGVALSPYVFKGMTFVPSMLASALIPLGVRTIVLHANTVSEIGLERTLAWVDEHREEFLSVTEAARRVPAGLTSFASRAGGRAVHTAVRLRVHLRDARNGRGARTS